MRDRLSLAATAVAGITQPQPPPTVGDPPELPERLTQPPVPYPPDVWTVDLQGLITCAPTDARVVVPGWLITRVRDAAAHGDPFAVALTEPGRIRHA